MKKKVNQNLFLILILTTTIILAFTLLLLPLPIEHFQTYKPILCNDTGNTNIQSNDFKLLLNKCLGTPDIIKYNACTNNNGTIKNQNYKNEYCSLPDTNSINKYCSIIYQNQGKYGWPKKYKIDLQYCCQPQTIHSETNSENSPPTSETCYRHILP